MSEPYNKFSGSFSRAASLTFPRSTHARRPDYAMSATIFPELCFLSLSPPRLSSETPARLLLVPRACLIPFLEVRAPLRNSDSELLHDRCTQPVRLLRCVGVQLCNHRSSQNICPLRKKAQNLTNSMFVKKFDFVFIFCFLIFLICYIDMKYCSWKNRNV